MSHHLVFLHKHFLVVFSHHPVLNHANEQAEQRDILGRMNFRLWPNIAHNGALLENVFVMFVCILNKIPVFVVGKPGNSKSLAIQLLNSSLRGEDSQDLLLRCDFNRFIGIIQVVVCALQCLSFL